MHSDHNGYGSPATADGQVPPGSEKVKFLLIQTEDVDINMETVEGECH